MQEQTRAERWLYSTLSGDSALTALLPAGGALGLPPIYGAPGPQNGLFPRVTWFSQAPGTDTRPVGSGPRAYTELLYQVQVIGQTETVWELEAIADRVDALLDGSRGGATSGGGHVLLAARTGGFVYAEVEEGVSFRHLGGIYRLLLIQS